MARCGGYYGGKVRNIVGDRLMVIFDRKDCFTNAINTAILMNSTSKYLLDKSFSHDEVRCGIGIDYGNVLVSKVGIIKRGSEKHGQQIARLAWEAGEHRFKAHRQGQQNNDRYDPHGTRRLSLHID